MWWSAGAPVIDIGKAGVVACLRVRGREVSGYRKCGRSRRSPGIQPADRLAGRTPGESRGDGGDGPVLETGLGCAGWVWFWLVQAHTSEGQRIAKVLEDAEIKLDSGYSCSALTIVTVRSSRFRKNHRVR
jgi:hypothetical protein